MISLTNSEIDEIFISFHLLDAGQGDFTITIPEKESLQRELQQVFKQFVDEPRLAERHQLNYLMFRLFMNAKASEFDERLGQHFLKTLLGAVHQQLLAANVFKKYQFILERLGDDIFDNIPGYIRETEITPVKMIGQFLMVQPA